LEAYKTVKDKVNGNLYAYVITKVWNGLHRK
jgi:hypothetical protein